MQARSKIKVSIIIPVRVITPYLKETVNKLLFQTRKDFEILIITDKEEKLKGAKIIPSGEPTPSYKRNLGAKIAKGEILAFLDDDSFPEKNWLKTAMDLFKEGIVGVCGPTLTPPEDNIYQKASGWVWASYIGSGGAGVYRNRIMPKREVDDFPSVNLLVRKKDFQRVGGFDLNHWPGEDTKLCLDLVNLGKKIIYDPKVLVFHHRRPVFKPHLKQISRYAERRGYFAKKYPQTSFRIGYLFPSFFSYGLMVGIILSIVSSQVRIIFILCASIYLLILILSGFEVWFKEKNIYLSLLTVCAIFLTHFTYGLIFPFGYFKKNIQTIPHKVDQNKRKYVGG